MTEHITVDTAQHATNTADTVQHAPHTADTVQQAPDTDTAQQAVEPLDRPSSSTHEQPPENKVKMLNSML
jgi:hypothetical protein